MPAMPAMPALPALPSRMAIGARPAQRGAVAPTPSWVADGGRRGASRGGGRSEDKLRQRIQWLNRNVCPSNEIVFEKVAPQLGQLDLGTAMELLKHFENSAAEVRNPSAWIASQARQAADPGRSQSMPPVKSEPQEPVAAPRRKRRASSAGLPVLEAKTVKNKQGRGGRLTYYEQGASEPGSEAKLKTRLDWLNANAALAAPLRYEALAPYLLPAGIRKAMQVLKSLEGKAHEVLDPEGYVLDNVG